MRVGEDLWVGYDENFNLPPKMVVSLRERGVFHHSQVND